MTMLSPLGRVPRRRPPVRRRSRRPGPALVLLLALSMLAVLVWWRVLHPGPAGSAASACQGRPAAAVLSLDPRRVKVRVYNATERAGLARSVAIQLRRRGFSISATSNDPLTDVRLVSGVGEVRYGAQGATAAELVSWHFPGVRKAEDPRSGAVVDIAVGPGFHRLATAAQIAKSKQAAKKATPGC
jgi:LytR cell envelope-related transcriptional attenuator